MLHALRRHHQVLHRRPGPHPPVLAAAPGRRPQLDRRADVPGVHRAAQRGHPDAGRRQRGQHGRQPVRPLVPPVPEQLGVVAGHHQARAPVPVRQVPQPAAHHVHEVRRVPPYRGRGQVRLPRPLRLRRHVPAGHPGRPEAGRVVEGVEVAVVRRARVAGLRRPDPVAHLEVATEAEHAGVADRPGRRGVAVQRGGVDHEALHPGGRVQLLQPGRVAALRRPDPGRCPAEPQPGVVQPGGQRGRGHPRVQQRLERVRRPGRRAARPRRRRPAAAAPRTARRSATGPPGRPGRRWPRPTPRRPAGAGAAPAGRPARPPAAASCRPRCAARAGSTGRPAWPRAPG